MSNYRECPCQSKKRFSQCCWPYIFGKALPLSAEALMRSRYSAYTRANIAYIKTTQIGPITERFDEIETKKWALGAKWLGLKIIKCQNGLAQDSTGHVEFIAKFKLNGQTQEIHENSEFHKVDGRWLYFSN